MHKQLSSFCLLMLLSGCSAWPTDGTFSGGWTSNSSGSPSLSKDFPSTAVGGGNSYQDITGAINHVCLTPGKPMLNADLLQAITARESNGASDDVGYDWYTKSTSLAANKGVSWGRGQVLEYRSLVNGGSIYDISLYTKLVNRAKYISWASVYHLDGKMLAGSGERNASGDTIYAKSQEGLRSQLNDNNRVYDIGVRYLGLQNPQPFDIFNPSHQNIAVIGELTTGGLQRNIYQALYRYNAGAGYAEDVYTRTRTAEGLTRAQISQELNCLISKAKYKSKKYR